MRELTKEVLDAIEIIRNAEIDGSDGLPEDLFLAISALIPVPNVDLLITNDEGQLLLSRRVDEFFGSCWHIPGGCLRYGETFEHRIQETAKHELGSEVLFDKNPISVRNVLRGIQKSQTHPRERTDNVTIIYNCRFPDGFEINNGDLREFNNGYIKWFDKLPEDILKVQRNAFGHILDRWERQEII